MTIVPSSYRLLGDLRYLVGQILSVSLDLLS